MPSSESTKNFASMRDKILSESGKEYWRSVEEYVDAPEFAEFVKSEYPDHAEDWDDSLSRRNFIKVMGASLAFAGLTGCVIQPPEKIVPYVRPSEDQLPGKPLYFATAMSLGGIATGLLAKSFDGRPIKLEGNPDHPGSLGSTDIFAQASLLDMYDPDRSQEILYRGSPTSWENFSTTLRAAIDENRGDGGAGIRFLTETVTSPTLQDQFKRVLAELPGSKWYQYEPVNTDNAFAGAKMAFGSPVNTVYKFDQADRVLTLDKDIFSGFNVRYIKDFSKKRAHSGEDEKISRLYAVETTISITGAKSDHRIAVKPSQMPEVAKAIAAALGVGGAKSTYNENAQWIAAMAKDLMANRGRSIVIPGDNQPPVVHALAHAMNAALGNVGTTVVYTEPLTVGQNTQIEQLRELVTDIDAGKVKMLVIMGGNPVYNTPADLKLTPQRLSAVPLRIRLGLHQDETGEVCHWQIADKHFLESWSDARAYDGTVTLIQPLVEALYGGKNAHELVQLFFKADYDKKDYDIIRAYWQTQNMSAGSPVAAVPTAAAATATRPGAAVAANTGTATAKTAGAAAASNSSASNTQGPATAPAAAQSFEDKWRKAVHDGLIANSAVAVKNVTPNTAFLSQPQQPINGSGIEVSILPDPSIYDGRFTNNGWLQELPNPLTKITWENVALISPATANRLGLNQANDKREISGGERGFAFVNTHGNNMSADTVRLKFQGSEIEKPVPVWIAPGQPDDVITIFMGYGRTRAGRVGTGLGYSAFDVMRSDAMNSGFGELSAPGAKATIVSSQIHFNMEGRDILRVWDVNDFENEAEHGKQPNNYPLSMYPTEKYAEQYKHNHKWGMSIDLNSCVGCNACVLACQSENNIPVVGKEQVERSREMHWMRVDAYYGGDVNAPDGPHFQPVLCQQCEQAPCEVVCPVTATVHNAEGLNDMVYNRCVGTRYCSNNCPYKVRRFNFLLYQDWDTPQYKLMRNPEVTIRSRGVMEKCTYCVQRIAAARIEAEKDARAIADGEVITACQSVCPTDAIVFGNLNDPNSRVSKAKQNRRDYKLLNELGTQPRTTYLAELKNQNSEMPDYRSPKVYRKEAETGAEGHAVGYVQAEGQ
ncbi:MAG: TAT-variant-translocated molybdopterin oxidoreductase [Pyrinomonadaceae bacterium]